MLTFERIQDNIDLIKENRRRTNIINSLTISNDTRTKFVLIDANYPFDDIDQLHETLGSAKKTLLFSHFHLDHTAHAFYHQKKYNVPIYIPIQEKDYLTDLNKLMEVVGISDLNIEESYKILVKKYMKFQECPTVNTYIPGRDNFEIGDIVIKSLHIPGHSPGHTAFQIENNHRDKGILYVSDIGSHPYYGDFNSDLDQYKKSIDYLEQIYLSGEYILIPAHGTIYREKDENFFNRIRKRINKNREKVLKALSRKKAKTLKEMVEERIITPKERVFEPIRGMYFLWDGGIIYQHLKELEKENRVLRTEGTNFLTQKFKLI